MLEEPVLHGTTRVVNKGVDAALVVRPEHVPAALEAARRCSVRGISTAVLEVTALDPPDRETLLFFSRTTGYLIFESESLLLAHQVPADCLQKTADGCTAEAFSKAVLAR